MTRFLLLAAGAACCWLNAAPIEAQGFLGKDAAQWQSDLSKKEPAARRNAAFALGKIGRDAEEAVPALLRCLRSDADKGVRETAAYALGQICRRGRTANEVVTALVQLLGTDADSGVRRSCAVALGHCASDAPAVRAALEKALGDKHDGVRQNAIWALGEICVTSGDLPLRSLRKGLQDQDKLVKRDAALALGKLVSFQPTGGDRDREQQENRRVAKVREDAAKAARDLVECAKHDYLELKKAAFATLASLPLADFKVEVLPVLLRACNNAGEELEIRRNAALALAGLGGDSVKPAIPILREALRNGDLDLKRLVALTFRQVGADGEPALPDLCQALQSKDLELRVNAAYGLGGLKKAGKKGVPALVAVVADSKEDADVRVAAAVSLQSIGACDEATAAIGTLVRVLEDPKQPVKVRERVLWSLRVHNIGLRDNDEVTSALARILTEPGLGAKVDAGGSSSGKMLRYDSAFLLSIFKQQQAPDEVLDVLLTFLHDNSIRIYKGLDVTGGGVKTEGGGAGKAGTAEVTTKDGRIMAIDALGVLGESRVKGREQIVTQLRVLRDSEFETEIKEAAGELLKKLGVK